MTHELQQEWWVEEWKSNRNVILSKKSTQYHEVIDVPAMEKRDIDFISRVVSEERRQTLKEVLEICNNFDLISSEVIEKIEQKLKE